jgi:hypothetical protein
MYIGQRGIARNRTNGKFKPRRPAGEERKEYKKEEKEKEPSVNTKEI